MEQTLLKKIIEAAVMASSKPLSIKAIQALFDDYELPTNEAIKAAVESLQADYAERGIELKSLASGYQFRVVSDVSTWVTRLWEEKAPRYSRALLETLALIAYRQPITRAEVEEVRGVAVSSHIMKTLMERQWVRVVGHKDVPGRPGIYATTKQFLDYFNLNSLSALPTLSELTDFLKVEHAGETISVDEALAETSDEEAISEQDPSTIQSSDVEAIAEEETDALLPSDDGEEASDTVAVVSDEVEAAREMENEPENEAEDAEQSTTDLTFEHLANRAEEMV